jgi:hypothetical protein
MKLIDTNEALELCKEYGVNTTLVTIIKWCQPHPKGYHIGRKIGGRWKVEPKKLKLILDGKQWLLIEKERERQNKEQMEDMQNQP